VDDSCVRRSVRSTAARTRRTSAAELGSSCAAALGAALNDRPTAGEPRPVVSGSCALGTGFAVCDIDDVVDFCKSDWPFGALCSGAATSGARRRSSMLCAPRPAAPASATTHAVIKAFFIAISGSPNTDEERNHQRSTHAPPNERIRGAEVRSQELFFANDTQMVLARGTLRRISLGYKRQFTGEEFAYRNHNEVAAIPARTPAGTNAAARRRHS
jgi:hypothetical protein